MNEKEKAPASLTQEKIDHALNVLLRAAQAGQSPTPVASPRLDRKMKAWHKQREKNNALIEECKQTHEIVYRLIRDALPEDYRDLFRLYGVLVLADPYLSHYSATPVMYRLYKDVNQKAKALVEKREKRKARGKS